MTQITLVPHVLHPDKIIVRSVHVLKQIIMMMGKMKNVNPVYTYAQHVKFIPIIVLHVIPIDHSHLAVTAFKDFTMNLRLATVIYDEIQSMWF